MQTPREPSHHLFLDLAEAELDHLEQRLTSAATRIGVGLTAIAVLAVSVGVYGASTLNRSDNELERLAQIGSRTKLTESHRGVTAHLPSIWSQTSGSAQHR